MTERKNEAVFKRMTQVGITFLVQMLFLFLLAGSVRWVWAWVLLGINILVLAVNSIILPKELISERGKPKENVKKWDKIITVISIFPVLCIYIISGLDQRSGWTGDVSLWVHFTGVLMMLLGNGIFTWAMMSNKFFSTVVRIQDDRNHSVATAGPYKIIYLSPLFSLIAMYRSISGFFAMLLSS